MFVAATEGYPNPLDRSTYSEEFTDFVCQCLKKEPSERQTVEELREVSNINVSFISNPN